MFSVGGSTPTASQPKTQPFNPLWQQPGQAIGYGPNTGGNGNQGGGGGNGGGGNNTAGGNAGAKSAFGPKVTISDDPSNLYPDAIAPAIQHVFDTANASNGFMPVPGPVLPGYNDSFKAGVKNFNQLNSQNLAQEMNGASLAQLSKLAANGGATAEMRQPMNVLGNISSGQLQISTGSAYKDMARNPLSAYQQQAGDAYQGLMANPLSNYQLQAANPYQTASSGGMNVGTSNFNQALNSQMNKAQNQAYNTLGNTGYVSTQGWEDYSQGNLNQYQQAAVDAAMGAMSASAVNTGQFSGLGDANSQQNQASDVMEKLAAGDYQVGTGNVSSVYDQLQSGPSYSEQNLQALATQDPANMPFIGELEALINQDLIAQQKAAASAAGRGYGSGYEASQTMDAISRNVLEGRLAQYNQNVAQQLAANQQMDANRYTGLGMSLDAANALANIEAGNIGIIQTGAGQLADLGATLNAQQFREAENVAAAQAQNAQLQAIARGEVAGMGNQIAGQQLAGLQGLSAAEIANIERNLNVAGQYQNLGNYLASNQLSAANSVANIQAQNYARQLQGADSLANLGQQQIINQMTGANNLSNLGQQSIANQQAALNSLTNVQNANIGNRANASQAALANSQQNVNNMMRAQALTPELINAMYADIDRQLALGREIQNRTDAIYTGERANQAQANMAPFNLASWLMQTSGANPSSALQYEMGTDQINANKPSSIGQALGIAGSVGTIANQTGLLQPAINGVASVGGSILGGLFG